MGSDFRAGIPSLPVVIALYETAELKRLFSNGAKPTDGLYDRALSLISAPSIIRRAHTMVADQIASARKLLHELPSSEFRASLSILLDDQLAREA